MRETSILVRILGQTEISKERCRKQFLSTLYPVVDLPVNTGPFAEMQPNTGHSTQLDALPFRPKHVNFDKAYPWQVILV